MIRGLWRDHPSSRKRATQAEVLLAMLRNARVREGFVALPQIMAAGIAQHGARFNELRSRGFVIQNDLHLDRSGIVRSKYWLKYDPEKDGGDEK